MCRVIGIPVQAISPRTYQECSVRAIASSFQASTATQLCQRPEESARARQDQVREGERTIDGPDFSEGATLA